jgi:glycosyltransferase involved in cell wall biosynthesis
MCGHRQGGIASFDSVPPVSRLTGSRHGLFHSEPALASPLLPDTASCRLPPALWPVCVSVVVPTANRPHLLAEALASIRRLEGPDLTFEIIVVDNRPSPATERVARDFGAVYLRECRPGPAAARNAGVRAANAEFVAFLDDDDLWTTDHIRPHLLELLRNPQVDAVVSQYVGTDTNRSPVSDPFPPRSCNFSEIFFMFLQYMPQIGTTVVRKSTFPRIGYFDESLRYGEDWDWHLRLALRCRVVVLPVPSVLYRLRPAGRDQDMLIARQRKYLTRHFWSNILRARRYGVNIEYFRAFRLYCTHIGGHVRTLLIHSLHYAQTQQFYLSMRAILLACYVSPVHFLYYALTWPSVRRLLPLLPIRVCAKAVRRRRSCCPEQPVGAQDTAERGR